MKTAYRIVTPVLAVASIVLAFFLKFFTFVVGNADEKVNQLIGAISQLSQGKLNTTYEFSLFEIFKMLPNAKPEAALPAADGTAQQAKTLAEIASPILPDVYKFIALFAIVVIIMLAVAVVSALANSKKKRNSIFFLCGGGFIFSIASIFVSNSAFEKIISGEVNLTEVVALFAKSDLATLATAILSVTSATLAAGFYSLFAFFIVISIWTVISNMLISTPIQATRKHRRKKPMKSLSAIIKK